MSECPACGATLTPGVAPWHLKCTDCSYEGSSLEPRILDQKAGNDLDEHAREDALRTLRIANFDLLAKRVALLLPAGSQGPRRLLDVGCAHGWFLQRMSGEYDVAGIEPDPLIADVARGRGFDVKSGFFPDVVGAETYDLIAFNDVLEHIPDVAGTLAACHAHLNAGGHVIVNAPDRTGFLYRLSKAMARVGLSRSFDRMWQVGFPSPHLHYFDTPNMQRLARNAGFSVADTFALPTVSHDGLYSRVRYDKSVSAAKAGLLTAVLGALIPALAILPADIRVWILRKD
ncbi:class I SAM-dependent methyltransferase [Pseudoxanthomonas sp.]|jgi:2-polyprenyl-3-methyl-5-hydroxy-6-metoxy-1,4-benzoquinol methylase|uniref:class I SAM-dependent methyltransferase n=1 Tax=Pseudoxanthomonas sp. TaxID=1871049 RepID=UPI002FE2B8CA